jgi:hypothetical protein
MTENGIEAVDLEVIELADDMLHCVSGGRDSNRIADVSP